MFCLTHIIRLIVVYVFSLSFFELYVSIDRVPYYPNILLSSPLCMSLSHAFDFPV